MEGKDYFLKVKYSVTAVSGEGKKKIYSKKSMKPLSGIDPVEIMSNIDTIEKELKKPQKNMVLKSKSGFFSSFNDFINKWKMAYYEMLTL